MKLRDKVFLFLLGSIVLCYVLFSLFHKTTANNVVSVNEVYTIADYVYFDPVTDGVCNDSNYWTIYNQNTTCYRFIVLELNDTADSDTLKIMLDHNIGYDIYDNYLEILKEHTSSWKKYRGSVDIIDEETIFNLMKLTTKPTLDNISVNGSVPYYYFVTNSLYIYNGVGKDYNGFWSKDLYDFDKNYVYGVTTQGNNTLISRNSKSGIRPVINVSKSLLTKLSNMSDISSYMDNANVYKYTYSKEKFDGYIYKQLQGFTVTKDKLVFYSSNNGNPDNGVMFTYSGDNYRTLYKTEYGSTGHGNDMTYNNKTNKVLLVGPNEYKEIYEYNGDTLTFEKKYVSDNLERNQYTSIGYDEINDYYFALSNSRIYVLDRDFNQLYSFDAPISGVYQGLEYKNGYLYLSTFEYTCSKYYQLLCLNKQWSSITYVYNVKFKSDGSPANDFGRLVDRLYIRDRIGELESISFHNNYVYFGYASQIFDSKYAYKFYSFPYSKIAYHIDYDINYIDNNNEMIVNISSSEELKNIDGWTLSSDLHTLSKKFTENTASTNLDVCDLYNNCSLITLKSLYFINVSSTKYDVNNDDNYIKYIDEGITVTNFLANIDLPGGTVKLYDVDGNEKKSLDIVATGDKMIIYVDDTEYDVYTLSVMGDLSGDGIIGLIDLVKMRKEIVKYINSKNKDVEFSDDIYYYALDMDKDGKIGLLDLSRIRKIVVDNDELES